MNTETINALKARAYDLLAIIEAARGELTKVNNMIGQEIANGNVVKQPGEADSEAKKE